MKKMLLFLSLITAATLPALSENAPDGEKDDPVGRNLFPPELVMQHQQQIGLTEGQRAAIKKEVEGAQSKFLDLQWQMQAESEKLVGLLQARPVDEARALAQADSVMSLERTIKKTHLGVLIRIKNALTAEQQEELKKIRQK